jgi:hypothetical protein
MAESSQVERYQGIELNEASIEEVMNPPRSNSQLSLVCILNELPVIPAHGCAEVTSEQ